MVMPDSPILVFESDSPHFYGFRDTRSAIDWLELKQGQSVKAIDASLNYFTIVPGGSIDQFDTISIPKDDDYHRVGNILAHSQSGLTADEAIADLVRRIEPGTDSPDTFYLVPDSDSTTR